MAEINPSDQSWRTVSEHSRTRVVELLKALRRAKPEQIAAMQVQMAEHLTILKLDPRYEAAFKATSITFSELFDE
jgi:hypothetical protein